MVHQSEMENYNIGQASIEEVSDPAYKGAKIVVIGVGGGGSNMIKHLVEYGVHQDVTPIATNTDGQHLKNNPAPVKILLGKESTGGLGAGGIPDIGRKAAEESANEIREAIKDAKLVIVSTGLGGGTGTGATPTIVKIAKEVGALTIAIVTKPFKYEGSQKSKKAEEGLKELEQSSDSILVIPNDKILLTMKKNASTKECYKEVDDVLVRAVSGISTIITKPGDINVDFSDLKSALGFKGFALMGIGEATGEESAKLAVENAIQSPLLDDASIDGAKSIIVFFCSTTLIILCMLILKLVYLFKNEPIKMLMLSLANTRARVSPLIMCALLSLQPVLKETAVERVWNLSLRPLSLW